MSFKDDAGRTSEQQQKGTALEMFQRKHAFNILLYLNDVGVAMESEVERDVAKGKITGEILEEFERAGLISRKVAKSSNDNRHLATHWSIEPAGRAVAGLFRRAEKIIAGELYIDANTGIDDNGQVMPDVRYNDDARWRRRPSLYKYLYNSPSQVFEMSDEDDYMALLNRAKIACPETIENHERFEIPELEILQEGKITVFRNFIDVTDKLRRDPQHVLQFLLKELGAPGNVEGRRAVFKAKISPNQINDKIQMYTETYVICSECGLPDTKMVKDGRTLMLECEACGARRPITVRKSVRADTANTLREGDIIELQITDVGKKGDGVGKFHDYLVVVPGTVKGAKIHAKISKISAKTAFAVPTTEACTR